MLHRPSVKRGVAMFTSVWD